MNRSPAPPLFVLATLLCAAAPARSAESYDSCAGFVDSVPAVIATQGVWCLRGDLATGITSGTAIEITTHNVTLDCNGFKLGGLLAGPGTQAIGIGSPSGRNLVVRNCNVRGFMHGIMLSASGGSHLVEDNRLEGNILRGISINGDGSVVRRNQVLDTGPGTSSSYGILTFASVDLFDNSVTGVEAPADAWAYGIQMADAYGSRASGNVVRQMSTTAMESYGIYGVGGGFAMVDNQVHGPVDIGVRCGNATGVARDNIVFSATTAVAICTSVDNTASP